MENLIVPELIEIQLADLSGQPVKLENLAVYIKTKARRKNDFSLGPFFSDKNGIIEISKTDFMNEVNATYDSGLMDYSSIETNFPEVEIIPYNKLEIERMINSRTQIWTSLLNGENERWDSINILVDNLRKSENKNIDTEKFEKLLCYFHGKQSEFKFKMKIKN
jgi:hypothetical protein